MVCDGSVSRETMGTAERIEEFGATERLDEKSDIEFMFRIVAMGSVQAVDGLLDTHDDHGHAAATPERNSENGFKSLDIIQSKHLE